jgi:hypothetical protein
MLILSDCGDGCIDCLYEDSSGSETCFLTEDGQVLFDFSSGVGSCCK